jgi:hypothetical protein
MMVTTCGCKRRPFDLDQNVRHIDAVGTYRVSNAERDAVVEQLRSHAADGRLSFEELDERMDQTLAATTYDDLGQVLSDLPRSAASRAAIAPRRRPPAAAPFVLIAFALLVVIIGVALTGHFFPFLPLAPLGLWTLFVAWRLSRWRTRRVGAH